jgi:hypothetical protein
VDYFVVFFIVIFLLSVPYLLLFRRRLHLMRVRRYELMCRLGEGVFYQDDLGNLVIYPRTFRTWLLLLLLGGATVCMLVWLYTSLAGGLIPVPPLVSSLTELVFLLGPIGFIFAALFLLWRMLRQEFIHVDSETEGIEVGRGLSIEILPFHQIEAVFLLPSHEEDEENTLTIGVTQQNGERYELASIEVEEESTLNCCVALSQAIASLLNVPRIGSKATKLSEPSSGTEPHQSL